LVYGGGGYGVDVTSVVVKLELGPDSETCAMCRDHDDSFSTPRPSTVR
jgi:hypothetical protein